MHAVNVCSLPRRSLRKCLVMLFFICRLSSSVVGSMTEYRYRRRNCFHRKSFCDLKMEKENRDDFSLLYGSKAKRFHEDPDQGAYYLCVLMFPWTLPFGIHRHVRMRSVFPPLPPPHRILQSWLTVQDRTTESEKFQICIMIWKL